MCWRIRGSDDPEVGEWDINAPMQVGESFSSQGFQSNAISRYTSSKWAKVGGPVQYRWMYRIERFLIYLKPIVSNRARGEGWDVKQGDLGDYEENAREKQNIQYTG
jgi:hypothetical protein